MRRAEQFWFSLRNTKTNNSNNSNTVKKNTTAKDESEVVVQQCTGRGCRLLALACCLTLLVTAALLLSLPSGGQTYTVTGQSLDSPYHITLPSLRTSKAKGCSINECAVTCKNLDAAGIQPGHEAAAFIEANTDVMGNCQGTVTLEMIECKFPEERLDKMWFTDRDLGVTVRALILRSCSIRRVDDSAFRFSPAMGSALKILVFAENPLNTISLGMLQGLTRLDTLEWRNRMALKHVDPGALSVAVSSLQVLQVQGGLDNAEVLVNLTGDGRDGALLKLLTVDLRFNPNTGVLSGNQLSALTRTQSLYLSDSGVTSVQNAQVFNAMSNSLNTLNLSKNQLRTLPLGIFDKMVAANKRTSIFLAENRWNCDCNLLWLQQIFIENRGGLVLRDNALCYNPPSLRDVPLLEANMTCSEVTTSTSSTSYPEEPSTTRIPSTEGVHCQVSEKPLHAWFLSMAPYDIIPLPTRMPDFQVAELPNDGQNDKSVVAYVNTGQKDISREKTLVWSRSDTPSDEIGCYRNVVGEVAVYNLSRGASYVFCMLESDRLDTAPTHCLALTTQPEWPKRTWLDNDDRVVAITGLVIAAIVCALLGAGAVLFAAWKRPSMLSLSDRVIVVRHRTADVLVVPGTKGRKGSSADVERSVNDGMSTRSNSVLGSVRDEPDNISVVSSDPSYVSIRPPTAIGLFMYRVRQLMIRLRPRPKVIEGQRVRRHTKSPEVSLSPDGSPPPLPLPNAGEVHL